MPMNFARLHVEIPRPGFMQGTGSEGLCVAAASRRLARRRKRRAVYLAGAAPAHGRFRPELANWRPGIAASFGGCRLEPALNTEAFRFCTSVSSMMR